MPGALPWCMYPDTGMFTVTITGIEAKNRAVLHGHCHQCLNRIKAERNPWRVLQLLEHEMTHRQRTKAIRQMVRQLDYRHVK